MVDVTKLSREQASDYRRELLHAIYHPGIEFDMVGEQGKIDHDAYKRKVAELDTYLRSFG